MNKTFQVFFWFTGWDQISFGISFDLSFPNIEIHIPFGFIKIGWDYPQGISGNWWRIKHRYFPLIR